MSARRSPESIGSGADLGSGADRQVARSYLVSVSLRFGHKAGCMYVTDTPDNAISDDPVPVVLTLLG